VSEEDEYLSCPKCGSDLEWADCWNDCEDGWEDRYDEDPLWYGHELYPCDVCQTKGGWWYCAYCEALAEKKQAEDLAKKRAW
jgi:hypothetical protein